MSLQLVHNAQDPNATRGTSGDGSLQHQNTKVILISGALNLSRTSEHVPSPADSRQWTTAQAEELPSPPAAIAELRRLSGLTWDQLARLFSVARRSVHFWASGKPMNAVNEERLARLLATIRQIDRGSARQTRIALLTPLDDGTIPLDLLIAGDLAEAVKRIGRTPQRARPKPPALSAAAQTNRRPAPPGELVGALHDPVHRET